MSPMKKGKKGHKKGPKVANAVKAYVKKEIEVQKEEKYYYVGSQEKFDAGHVTNLFAPPEGSEQSQRVGSQVLGHRMEIRGSVQTPVQGGSALSLTFGATGACISNNRHILFLDKLNTGTAPAVTDILQTQDWAAGYTQDAVNEKRYRILSDKTFQLHPVAEQGSGVQLFMDDRSTHLINEKRSLGKVKMEFAADSATPLKNGLWQLLISDIGAGSNSQFPTFDYICTTRFTDA